MCGHGEVAGLVAEERVSLGGGTEHRAPWTDSETFRSETEQPHWWTVDRIDKNGASRWGSAWAIR